MRFEVKDGKIVRELYGYPNVGAALEAAGVRQAFLGCGALRSR
jgi:hypothetical protein